MPKALWHGWAPLASLGLPSPRSCLEMVPALQAWGVLAWGWCGGVCLLPSRCCLPKALLKGFASPRVMWERQPAPKHPSKMLKHAYTSGGEAHHRLNWSVRTWNGWNGFQSHNVKSLFSLSAVPPQQRAGTLPQGGRSSCRGEVFCLLKELCFIYYLGSLGFVLFRFIFLQLLSDCHSTEN